ncbi:MAG: type II toxin-antitoxin system VapC family toxin [Elusimicrobia bacterium]|nr:type II toxin-antitoxin system VapC family toxin [Elusimicrobiota bacterium]
MSPGSLDDIPRGSLCVVDTNILLYAEEGASLQAQRFVQRIVRRELVGTLPQPVWHELSHKLMLAEALALGLVTASRPAQRLGVNPETVRRLSLYRDKLTALSTMGFGFEPCTRQDFMENAFEQQRKYGLLTNDSVVLAIALRLKADALVTADQALLSIQDIPVFRPTDLRLGGLP